MPDPGSEPGWESRAAQSAQRDRKYTSARAVIWNTLAALAIITILFVTFYSLTQRDPSTGTEGPATTAATPTPSQTAGQGNTQNKAAPDGNGGR
jgi:hypothetical protein